MERYAKLIYNGQAPLIKIVFPFNREDLSLVQSLYGRKFAATKRYWTCPITIENVKALKNADFYIFRAVKRAVRISSKPKSFELDWRLCPLWRIKNANGNICKNTMAQKTHKKIPGTWSHKRSQTKGTSEIDRNWKGSQLSFEGFESNKGSNEEARSETQNETIDQQLRQEIWYKFQRGQWSANDFNNKTCKRIIFSLWIQEGVCNKYKECKELVSECIKCIQSGLRESGNEIGNRTGRSTAQETRTNKKGQKEKQDIESPWVDCNTLAALQTKSLLKGFKKNLREFQMKDLLRMDHQNGRILLGLEMGLGKTIEALAYLQLHRELRPAIIAVPGSLKPNWEREANICIPKANTNVLYGLKPQSQIPGDIIILNYEILANRYRKDPDNPRRAVEIPRTGWVDYLIDLKPQVVIADEAHFLLNPSAYRTKSFKKLAKATPHVIGLSGTPAKNRAREIDTIVRIIDPTILPPFWTCAFKYYGAHRTQFGWNFDGATNKEEFHKLLTSTILIRRKKSEVLKDLPDKERSFVPIELSNRREYERAETDFIQWLKENKGDKAAEKALRAKHLVKIEALKQLSVKGKMKQCIEWIKTFLETEDKLAVFATHTATIETLLEEFGDITIRYDGKVSTKQRDLNLQQFHTDPKKRLFVGMFDKNGQPAGVGITITAASSAAILELQWTPAVHDQLEDREHRIGQTNRVNIYYLLGLNTIEERIVKILDGKRKVLDAILDGKETESSSLLTDLIADYRKEKR